MANEAPVCREPMIDLRSPYFTGRSDIVSGEFIRLRRNHESVSDRIADEFRGSRENACIESGSQNRKQPDEFRGVGGSVFYIVIKIHFGFSSINISTSKPSEWSNV